LRVGRGPAKFFEQEATYLAFEFTNDRNPIREFRSPVMFKLTVLFVTITLAAVVALGQAPTLQIVTPDGPNLPADLYYGNIKVKPLRLRPGTNQIITIDDADFFVNQHYVDFLNRFPDQGGFNYWTGQITKCGADQSCINARRIDVSNSFFFEQEFQQTGAYVYRVYRIAFGNTQPFPNSDTSNQTEANKIPQYAHFKADRQQVVGGSNLSQEQLALANDFVGRAEFTSRYPANQSLDQFVDAILATIKNDLGVDLTSQRGSLIALGSRGTVLYRLANDDLQGGNGGINNRAVIDAEYNRAFVYTEYGGYLRRDSDVGGFLFWLNQVNHGPLRDGNTQHAMVCSFVTSKEYQLRFGSAVTHTNAECPQ
jgi:hypothetical protein